MSENAEKAFTLFREVEGKESATGDWMEINQDIIDQFADVTLDHQFIHIDPERAKATPFGTTIAHGFLTLSLLTHLGASANPADPDPARFAGMVMGVNYGFEKVRFIAPVKAGGRIRARVTLAGAEERESGRHILRLAVTVEIEGEERPALIADWLNMFIREGP